jgi:hypothetical protein
MVRCRMVSMLWLCGLAAISAAAPAAAQTPSGEGKPYHCTASVLLPTYRAHETYYQDRVVFKSDESVAWILFWWSEFLHTKYSLGDLNISPNCDVISADPAAQQARLNAEKTGWKMMMNPFVEVDWAPTQTPPPGESEPVSVEIFAGHRMNQTPPAPRPSAPPASATAEPVKNHHYYYCSSEQRPPTMYFSSAFDTTDEHPQAMAEGFKKFLEQKYGYHTENTLACFGAHGTLAAAQADVQQRMKDLRVVGKWKIVETGWVWGGTPPPPPTPVPPGVDPAVNQLKEPFRTWAINEVPGSKAYCAQTPMISGVFDCDCFSRAVLHARIANAGDYRTPVPGREDMAGFDPLGNLFYGDKLPCTECLDDARLSKYASEQVKKSLANVIQQKGSSDPSVTHTTSCAVAKFVADFRAKPYVSGIQGWMNNAIATCYSKHAND